MPELVVELYGVQVGVLREERNTFDFIATSDALRTFGIDSLVLSVAAPLTAVPTRTNGRKRRNFFHELLPEGRMLSRLAWEARVGEEDTIGLLRVYGRDVAGAVQVWDPATPGEPKRPRLEHLTEAGVAALLDNVQDYPLGNKPVGGKSSLAGVQDKIVLVHNPDGWHRALDGYPSTHILKPVPSDLPTIIYDEAYGSTLAEAAGLTTFRTWLEEFNGVPALVIERYDRSPTSPPERIHQEDFNQALGARSNEKYQRYGGKVSLGRIAHVLGQVTDDDSVERLLRMVTLAVAVGNLDMHAKNVSLVHYRDGTITLAPTYDFVPQAHQRNDGELALAVGGVYRHAEVTRLHLVDEGHAWGIGHAERVVDEVLETTRATVGNVAPHDRAYARLMDDIAGFTTNLLEGRAVGTR